MERVLRLYVVVGALLCLTLVGCPKEPLLEQTQHLDNNEYWYGTFNSEETAELDVEFNVTSGGAVDLLLLNSTGFADFENCHKTDTLVNATGRLESLPPNDSINYFFDVRVNDQITISFTADHGTFVGLYHQNGTAIYEKDSLIALTYEYTATQAEKLDLFFWNLSTSVAVNYTVKVTRPKATTFSYYISGSALNIKAKTYVFEAPETGNYTVVVNNTGGIQGGATPAGPVDFEVIIK